MTRRIVLEFALVLTVLLAAGWLRLQELDRFIVSDEQRWACRSIDFHAALAERDWARTFQVGHPGVVTMWLASAALPLEEAGQWRGVCRVSEGGHDYEVLEQPEMRGVLQTLPARLLAMRRGVAVGTTVLLGIVYLLARFVAGLSAAPALGGLALLAFDPFLVAHSRVLHLDALTALLTLAAVVALPPLSRAPRVDRRVLLAGGLGGLAMIEKSSALLLVPFAALTLGWAGWRAGARREAARALVAWGAAAGAAVALAWPAMWVAPLATVARMLSKATSEGGMPHDSGTYFLGRPVGDPGPLFYPVAALARLTPWGLLAGMAAVVVLARRRSGVQPRAFAGQAPDDPTHRLVRRLVLWALFFGLFMTVGPKKFDRYLLPSLVALLFAGGTALTVLAARWADRRGTARAAAVGWLVPVLLGALQLAETARSEPYPMAYFSPLVGGARGASRLVLVGWGEGHERAADYLNERLAGNPDAADVVAAVRGESNFAPLFVGQTLSAAGYKAGRTDYVVVYVSQVQRRLNPEVLERYYDRTDVAPAFVGGWRACRSSGSTATRPWTPCSRRCAGARRRVTS
jgi:hypothetical protein